MYDCGAGYGWAYSLVYIELTAHIVGRVNSTISKVADHLHFLRLYSPQTSSGTMGSEESNSFGEGRRRTSFTAPPEQAGRMYRLLTTVAKQRSLTT
jgi:hypothetical protein